MTLSSFLLSLALSLLLTVPFSHGDLYEGDACVVNNGAGTCKVLQQCPAVIAELLKGKMPSKLCGFSGTDTIICCPNDNVPSSTTEPSTTETPVRGGPGPLISNDSGVISKAKCKEYSKEVYQFVVPPVPFATPVNVSVCGIKSSSKLIVGGTRASPREFPHIAAIGFKDKGKIIWNCGGSLISKKFVLTAAHCLFNVNWGTASRVRLGDLNLVRTDDLADPQDIDVVRRIRHPEYQSSGLRYHDIGLLELETEARFGEYVRPVCLAYSTPDTDEANAIAAGWGLQDNDDDNGSNDLLKVTISLVPHATCNRYYSNYNNDVVNERQICAGDVGKDTCMGDSGGPLMVLNKDFDCMYSLVGVTSLGGICGSGVPGVYTRVKYYIPWIESIVWPNGS